MKSEINRLEAKRIRQDYAFSRIVALFGFLVLATFAMLIFHIVSNALPLFKSPSIEFKQLIPSEHAKTTDALINVSGDWFSVAFDSCSMVVRPIPLGKQLQSKSKTFSQSCDKRTLGLVNEQSNIIANLSEEGRLELLSLDNTTELSLSLLTSFMLPAEFLANTQYKNWHIEVSQERLFMASQEGDKVLSFWHELNSLSVPTVIKTENARFMKPLIKRKQVVAYIDGILTVLGLNDAYSTNMPAQYNVLQQVSLRANVEHINVLPNSLEVLIQTSSELLKYNLYNQQGQFVLKPAFNFPLPNIEKPIERVRYYADPQHNALLVILNAQHVYVINAVTGSQMAYFKLKAPFSAFQYSRTVLLSADDKAFRQHQLDNLAGMTNLEMLFGKNEYAGYGEAQYIWQTSMSSDYQQAKYSVIPLIMGSLKASLLALVVALPLALGAAIYTAYFAQADLRSKIKPIIEMLEAIPSVVLGFIAAIWIAPFAQQYIQATFIALIMLPFLVVVIAMLHSVVKPKLANTFLHSWQFLINGLIFFIALVIIFSLSSLYFDWAAMGSANINGAPPQSGITLSKTAIVVSVALGVAIAPTIYTLIDDALFEVPEGLKQASFALGATPVQTLFKVVLVVAMPSIVSAIMLGFGRAFGETMIVLMVTGNTPIANWDFFAGIRTLTSNLAIELQEAQVDSTLYSVLFFTATLLFIFTFIINTIASFLKRSIKGSH